MRSERGIAMVLALFLMSALSVLAASMMFLSQTETYATMNYRMMSQARYAAEAGIQKSANFLLDTTKYSMPGTSGNDDLAFYNRNTSPVTCADSSVCTLNQPIVLSASTLATTNYPNTALQPSSSTTVAAGYSSAAQGSLTAGTQGLSYGTYATLISMEVFISYGGSQQVVQTWQVTSEGSITSGRTATVQVEGLLETAKVPANAYAAFATSNQCSALHFSGNVDIDSYDSSQGTYATTVTSAGGNVGTNGNFEVNGNSVDVMGNLYSPRTGVGACSNNGTITALTGKTGTISGSVVQLPTSVVYPTPTFSPWPPTTTVTIDSALLAGGGASACAALGLTFGVTSGVAPTANCDLRNASNQSAAGGAAGPYTKIVMDAGNGMGDITLPNVRMGSGISMVLVGHSPASSIVNMNSLTPAVNNCNCQLEVDANLTGNLNESVVLRVAGKNASGVTSSLPDPTDMEVPFDFSEMTWKQNATAPQQRMDAAALQIVYPGTGTLSMGGGNSQSAGVIYAPNANFEIQGTQDWYGSILSKTIWNHGDAKIHYDRRLSRDFYVAGQPMAGTFTWKRAS